MVLIGLIGYKHSGKDTFADYLVGHYGFQKHAFAEPVKEICKIMFHLTTEQMNDPQLKETKDERWGISPRQMMQKVGTDMVRQMWDDDFWVKNMDIRLRGIVNDTPVVVSDVRFLNEAQWIKEMGGVLVRIVDGTQHSDSHPSETEQLRIQEDVIVENNKNGLETFHHEIDAVLQKILEK